MGVAIGHSLNGDFGVFGIIVIIVVIFIIMRKIGIRIGGSKTNIQDNYGLICAMGRNTTYSVMRETLLMLCNHTEGLMKDLNLNIKDRKGDTILTLASLCGHKDIVIYAIKKGVDINARNYDRSTALILASCNGYKDIVEYLIAKGADMDMANEDGDTALRLAIHFGYKDIEKLLLKKGAKK